MVKSKSFVWKNLPAAFTAGLLFILSGCTSQPDPSPDAGVPVPKTEAEPAKKTQARASSNRPNVVIVITDDQGYGDLGSTGNPIIQTPMLDSLAKESVCLTDYHVAPTCSPTRAALMSGHWTNRTGAWHTIMGRSMLREDEGTLGQFFQDAGYRTDVNAQASSWYVGLQWPDTFITGNDLGMAVGQAPFVTNTGYGDDGWKSPLDSNYMWEWWYKFQVSDSITVTPAIYYISNYEGQQGRSGNNTVDVFGGLLKTTFKF